jgi:predicted aspartyl protease
MYLHARAALLFMALSFTAPALAEDCSLKAVASLDMLPSAHRILVSASLNGTEMPMLVDTGAGVSSVSDKTVNALGLTRQESQLKSLDMYGNASREFVRLDTVQLGSLKGKDVNLMIWAGRDVAFNGLIGGDMLERYDVELNFVTRKLNLFSQDHCEGKVVYWPATSGTVVPFSMTRPLRSNTLGMEIGHDTLIRVPVTLDGKAIRAMIDTGAPTTTMSADTAERLFGITAHSPGVIPNSDAQDPTFGYVFHTLSFGGITAANPHIDIFPDIVGKNDPDNATVTGSMIARRDSEIGSELIIGMDMLTHLHLYIAYREQKLYITPPDQPAAAAVMTPDQPIAAAADRH